MRILHIIQGVDLHLGGPVYSTQSEMREQMAQGNRVALLTTSFQARRPPLAHDALVRSVDEAGLFRGAELYVGKSWGHGTRLAAYGCSADCLRWLRDRMRSERARPDIVHIHGVFNRLGAASAAWARRFGVPYLIEPHGCLDQRCLAMGGRRLKQVFLRLSLNKDLRHAASLLASSASEVDDLKRLSPGTRVDCIPHGVDMPEADLAEAAREFHACFPETRGKRLLLYLSRITAKKRPELIVEAMAQLRGSHGDLMLVLAGNDDGYGAVVRAAAKRHHLENAVLWAGFLQGALKEGAYAASDLFVLPSVRENFGNVVTEALARGLPAVVTPGVATHVYVDTSAGGLTVGETPDALAEGIRRVLSENPRAMGERGRRYVAARLTWPIVMQEMDAIYRELIRQRAVSAAAA